MTIKTRKRKTELDLEKQILIHSIISTHFLKEVNLILKPKHFQIPYSKTAYKWVLEYFNKYNEAPSKRIEDIYKLERDSLQEAEANLVGEFLEDISEKFVDDGGKINVKYYVDKTFDYVTKSELKENAEKVLSLVELGRTKDAEDIYTNYKKSAKIVSPWINPNDLEYAKKVFEKEDEEALLKFPGALGDLIGEFRPGMLISSLGLAKAGKSFMLHEIRTLALFAGLKVVEINLEMTDDQLAKRYYQRISATGKNGGEYLYPVIDCAKNKNGTCKKTCRISKVSLNQNEYFEMADFKNQPKNYKICTVCRGTDDFEFSTWFEKGVMKELNYNNIRGKLKAAKRMFGDNYRLKVYPRFRGSCDMIERDLDLLEYTEGFVPNVVIVDYGDIVKPSNPNLIGREAINSVWQQLAGMATERNCLVATASHANLKNMYGKRSLTVDSVSEDGRKINNLDIMFSINQTPEEEKLGIARVAVVAHRHKSFNETDEVAIIRNLDTCQSLLDSEFVKSSECSL